MSKVSEGIAKYLLAQEDPELRKQRNVSGDCDNYLETEIDFLEKETAESSPVSCSEGKQFDENVIRRIFYHKKPRP